MICENCGIEHNRKSNSNRFCSLKCARSFSTKSKRKEINRKVSLTIKEKIKRGETVGCFRVALNKEDIYCKCCSKFLFNKVRKKENYYCKKCSYTSSEYISNLKKGIAGKVGGQRYNSGRGKMGWYKNYWCQSSYELAYVIYSIDHEIKFKRNSKSFIYEFEGKMHRFYPDFILEDETYVEIKGYVSEQWKAKLEQFPEHLTLKVLYRNEMQNILSYVIDNYGKDFVNLYNEC